MKVLGTGKAGPYGGETFYIAQITHDEVRRIFDKASYSDREKFPELKVGDDVAIGDGHDFRRDICEATRKMTEAYSAFSKASATLHRFAALVGAAEASTKGAAE